MLPNTCRMYVGALLLVLGYTSLSACMTVGEDYTPPETQVDASWFNELPEGFAPGSADTELLTDWWTTFDDPFLTQLIERAATGNKSLSIAASRLSEARAQRAIAGSRNFPTVKGGADIYETRTSEATGFGQRNTLYSAGFDANWEADLFGGIARQIAAAEADVEASEAAYYDVRVTLLAETAINYVEIRSLQQQRAVALSNEASQASTLALVKANYEAGEISRLDVEQASANLAQVRASVPGLEARLSEAISRLAILLGEPPNALRGELGDTGHIPVVDREVAIGLPAEALRRRPDIRQAERELASAVADSGAARSLEYPSLTLIGSVGLEALDGGDLFNLDNRTVSVGPSLSLPIFNAGRIRQIIAIADTRVDQALLTYEMTVMQGLKDVEDALIFIQREQVREAQLQEAERAAMEVLRIAEEQYEAGEISFLSVLDAQRSQLSVQTQRADSNAAISSNTIRLFKALGGGWSPADEMEQEGATQ